MRRRHLFAAAATAAAFAPGARGQSALPVVGVLNATNAESAAASGRHAAFLRGLAEGGYVEGRNVTLELIFADGNYGRLAALADGLVARRVAVIAAVALPAAVAAKRATTTIPIVFLMGADPVQQGLVASMNRPGGNVTGISQVFGALGPKRLELLRELAPTASTVGVLGNPENPNFAAHLRDIATAAAGAGQRIEVAHASSAAAIDQAVTTLVERGARAAAR